MTIHITGQTAKTAPSAAAASAMRTGMSHAVTAIANAASRPSMAACHAALFRMPRATNTNAMGNSATSADSARLPPTGVNNW
jgi:hypothetical protein